MTLRLKATGINATGTTVTYQVIGLPWLRPLSKENVPFHQSRQRVTN
jgi:hypothetical protein